MSALLDYQHGNQRKDDNESALKLALPKGASKNYSLDFLQHWQEKYLQWQGNCFEVKPQYLDEWQAICAYIDPLLILAWAFAQKIKTGELQPEQLLGLNQCSQALKSDNNEHYADNHAHWGGHGSHRKAIVDFAFMPYSVDSKKTQWPTLNEFSFINAGLIDANQLSRLHHALFARLVESVLFNRQTTPLPDFIDVTSTYYTNTGLKTQIRIIDGDNPFLLLLQAAGRANPDKACLLLYTALFYAERYLELEPQTNKADWHSGLRAFVHTSQILRASMIHQGVGLGYFVEFFRHKTRKGESTKDYSRYSLGSDISQNIFREFKISPDAASQQKLKQLSKALIEKDLVDNILLCLHFSRNGKADDKWQQTKRQQLQQDSARLVRLFSSFEAQNHIPQNIEGKPSEQIRNLQNLVRGIDVAGNENELPIEVFAPTIRFLRSCPWQNRYPHYQPPRRLHLSIHVGEDYKHLLSGLRHIDETVTFCEMNHDDRLGHALALGVDARQWASRQGTVLISAGEHLDNLVWLHHMAMVVSMAYPDILPLIKTVEYRVSLWSLFIYGKRYDPLSLFQAWKLRRNCPLAAIKGEQQIRPESSALAPDYLKTPPTAKVESLWRDYFMSSHNARHQQEANKRTATVTIRHLSSLHPDAVTLADGDQKQDYFTEQELDYITAIQDHLMQAYDQKGIMIEACPSSNIYTGRFDRYDEHPLYRWNPPDKSSLNHGQSNNRFGLRSGPLKVCINTDDAGLFPTTIVNEHRVIKETAIKHFAIATEDADIWIDRIRDVGLKAFKRNHCHLV